MDQETIEIKQKQTKKRIGILLALIIGVILITGAYAFFTAVFTGVEDDTTISIGGGRLGLHMDGGNDIIMSNIYPRSESWATKRFTITGNNNTPLHMEYELSLVVTENTFSTNAITYTLESQNTTNDGTPMPSINTQRGIPTGSGAHPLGQGVFDEPGNDMVHTYYLNIFFPSRGVAQNEDQGATFRAYVGVGEATQETTFVKLSGHGFALDSDGVLWSWGSSTMSGFLETGNIAIPTALVYGYDDELLPRFTAIDSSSVSAIALDINGNIWTWGSGIDGGNGHGSEDSERRPRRIQTDINGNNLPTFVAVVDGGFTRAALDNQGRIWTWGGNNSGQLGNDNTENVHRPQMISNTDSFDSRTIEKLFNSDNEFFAIDDLGRTWIWGGQANLLLGGNQNEWIPITSPQLLTTIPELETGVRFITGGSSAAGSFIDSEGRIWMYGTRYNYNLGDGLETTWEFVLPQMMTNTPELSSGVRYISLSNAKNAALDSQGNVWTWGNRSGESHGGTPAGGETDPINSRPRMITGVPGFENIVEIGITNGVGSAIDANGDLWTWGRENGSGHGEAVMSPRKVTIFGE